MVVVTGGLRACPICPDCGGRKFKVLQNSQTAGASVTVQCLSCSKIISI
ncbi:MAG: hypothetical protein ABI361_06660 [Nitrososphaera sp.]